MIETVTFPVRFCSSCACDVVVARGLDDQDEWVDVCTRCSTTFAPGPSRRLAPSALTALGYDVEGEGGEIGCGAGGCGTCSGSTASACAV